MCISQLLSVVSWPPPLLVLCPQLKAASLPNPRLLFWGNPYPITGQSGGRIDPVWANSEKPCCSTAPCRVTWIFVATKWQFSSSPCPFWVPWLPYRGVVSRISVNKFLTHKSPLESLLAGDPSLQQLQFHSFGTIIQIMPNNYCDSIFLLHFPSSQQEEKSGTKQNQKS
jgi:hypothetical protein